uniref:Uncharacterized protein n=1 Tax=Anguilla anguilla TaxID=7936 RepID=A0A0E9SUF8_ANGAN
MHVSVCRLTFTRKLDIFVG